jgi:hypothetical protein
MLQLFIEADDEIWVLNPPVCRSRTEKRTVAKNEVYFSSLSHIWNQVLFSSFVYSLRPPPLSQSDVVSLLLALHRVTHGPVSDKRR